MGKACLIKVLLIIIPFTLLAKDPANKREMRGVWIATVNNIDWPSRPDLNSQQQQKEVISILDQHKAQGINAVFFQLRPSGDAFYPSNKEPWSQWLGVPGSYDPLAYWIEQCHQRGMEFHAWFNPYRAAANINRKPKDPKHIINRHPNWLLTYGNRMYLDPGIPEVRDYIIGVIEEVVVAYDIDGVHFDDYFYPYKIAGLEFPDQASFQKYGGDFPDLAEWRRNNTDQLINKVSQKIHQLKPYLKFGVSPFGVWRNQNEDPLGSSTSTDHTGFDDLYADVIKWLERDWIDYVTPQVYWHIGYDVAAYDVLLDWWSQHSYDKHIYIGQAAYKIDPSSKEPAWQNPLEMPNHLRLIEEYPGVQGSIYFSSRSLRNNPLGFADSLQSDFYRSPALPPEMSWKQAKLPKVPLLYRIRNTRKDVTLFWQDPPENTGPFLVVYRFAEGQPQTLDDPNHILAVVSSTDQSFSDHPDKKGYYTYLLTSLSRSGKESESSYPITVGYRKKEKE